MSSDPFYVCLKIPTRALHYVHVITSAEFCLTTKIFSKSNQALPVYFQTKMFCVLGPKRKKQENASLIYQQISITDSTLPSQCPQDSSMETPIYANPCDTSARTESSRGSASSSIKSKGKDRCLIIIIEEDWILWRCNRSD